MLRFRRYRVFLVFALFVTAALYYFTTVRDWQEATASSVESLKRYGQKEKTSSVLALVGTATLPEAFAVEVVPSTSALHNEASGELVWSKTHQGKETTARPSTSLLSPTPQALKEDVSLSEAPAEIVPTPVSQTAAAIQDNSVVPEGKGRFEGPPPLANQPTIHWTRLPEHFPVPSESIIQLPTGKPSHIPRIQHAFKDESPSARAARKQKLEAIKDVFTNTWKDYEDLAWGHDELAPVTGKPRDPFCGWGATLIDSLDTLYIMDLREEFERAVTAVGNVDFTTSSRPDIPVFETTIRYLGGLLSAYDLSQGAYKVLLTKAKELGDILMSTFDTPNRMPIMFYYWKPTFASNPHRAETRVYLAELGSLSMEFTRLAQITKESKYYDAVARITNELETLQNHTKIPGLWPRTLDASGCRKPTQPDNRSTEEESFATDPKNKILGGSNTAIDGGDNSLTSSRQTPTISQSVSHQKDADVTLVGSVSGNLPRNFPKLDERQLAIDSLVSSVPLAPELGNLASDGASRNDVSQEGSTPKAPQNSIVPSVDCEPMGLGSPPSTVIEDFTMGGTADSAYEYLPKQYLLLGGLVTQYRQMYLKAADAATKYLMYRPMVPDNRSTLALGLAQIGDPEKPDRINLTPHQEHLLCFAGGMFAIGAKIFARESDMDIASKLTDGCVWAYESTTTGIMPEAFELIPCKDRDKCDWNETRWYEELDPYRSDRETRHQAAQKNGIEAAKQVEIPSSTKDGAPTMLGSLARRDVEVIDDKAPKSIQPSAAQPDTATAETPTLGIQNRPPNIKADVPTAIQQETPNPPSETPNPYPTHEEYVQSRIKNERLPIGIPEIGSASYILRPEAIESVFIMYRITGDESWREKGWEMFNAVKSHTRVEHGYSAIDDVTSTAPRALDKMESFWLAETLKYCYLLFSSPEVISLDEYVFNTEAHPFKRPV